MNIYHLPICLSHGAPMELPWPSSGSPTWAPASRMCATMAWTGWRWDEFHGVNLDGTCMGNVWDMRKIWEKIISPAFHFP